WLTLGLGPVMGQTIRTVPVGGDIQTAINTANSGDIIQLADGTHTITAQLEVTKSLTIRNVGGGATIKLNKAQSTTSRVFLIPQSASPVSVLFENLTITGG